MSYPKQVIVVRKDLNMRKGKIAAQVAHASMGVLLGLCDVDKPQEEGAGWKWFFEVQDKSALDVWLNGAFTKICVYVNSEEELLEIYNKAKEKRLLCSLIKDSGKTEFNGIPTHTCAAIGPAFPEEFEGLTSHLPLL